MHGIGAFRVARCVKKLEVTLNLDDVKLLDI